MTVANQEVESAINGIFGSLFAEAEAMAVSDRELFDGIEDPRIVAKLQAGLASGAISRSTLVSAARMREAPKVTRRKPTRIYFIVAEATGLIKIGCSSDPESRLRTLQTGCPDLLSLITSIAGDEAVERDLHRQFAADRVRGEWFAPSSALLSFIEAAL